MAPMPHTKASIDSIMEVPSALHITPDQPLPPAGVQEPHI